MDRDALAAMPEAAPQGAVPAQGVHAGSFRALRSRPFRRFFAGQVISASGTFLQQTAIGWLVLQLTGSAAALGLVLAAGGVPSLLLGPWGGAIADPLVCAALVITGAAAFSFVTLASTTLQLHSSSAYRGRIMALWVFVYIGTTPIGGILAGWIAAAGGPRVALLVGSAACLLAAGIAARVHTPPNPDAVLTDLAR